jgi:hypothetical protein
MVARWQAVYATRFGNSADKPRSQEAGFHLLVIQPAELLARDWALRHHWR